MKNQIKGLRKLSTEEMEKVSGGSCFLAMADFALASHQHATNPSYETLAAWGIAGFAMRNACEM